MLESLLTFLFCCLMFAFMQTIKSDRKQQITDRATAEKTAFMEQLKTAETQFCDHNCKTENESLPIGTQTEEQNGFDCASQTADQLPLKHSSVQTLENFSQFQIQNYPQKSYANACQTENECLTIGIQTEQQNALDHESQTAKHSSVQRLENFTQLQIQNYPQNVHVYFRFRYPFLLTPIFLPTNSQRRKICLKSVSKNLLYIILEYAGGHYNFMLCDMKCYKFIKNMGKDALDHLHTRAYKNDICQETRTEVALLHIC